MKTFYQPPTKPRAIVYTAITGSYETLRDPDIIDKNIIYVCFTDTPVWNKLANNTVWIIRKISKSNLDPTKLARQIKTMPHLYLKEFECETSIWIDGNINIIGDIFELIKSYKNNNFICFKHYERSCAYQELNACIEQAKDNPDIMKEQMKTYIANGFPEHMGLVETNVLIRKHFDPNVIRLMEAWWNEIHQYSKRDQLSFPYVCWRQHFSPTLMGEDNARGNSAYFLVRPGWRTASNQSKLSILLERYILWRFR